MATNLGFYPAKCFTAGRGRWAKKADIIVFHTSAGYSGLKEFEANISKNPRLFTGTVAWFASGSGNNSAHFVTDRQGRYLNMVQLKNMAWCNGNNASTRKIAKKQLIRSRVDNANLYTYSIESEGSYGKVGDPPGTSEQLEAICECMYLCIDDMHANGVTTFVPDGEHLIGHCHIDPNRRINCPSKNYGKDYPWDYLIQKAFEYCEKKYPGWVKGTVSNTKPVTPPTDPGSITTSDSIGVGDTVRILSGATWYGSSSKISSVYLNGRTYVVDELRGDRAVLDKKGICSPIHVKYLQVIQKANFHEEGDDQNKAEVIQQGDSVTINAGATWYNSKSVVPSWAIGTVYTVDELSGDRALLSKKSINSPIHTKYLTKVDSSKVKDPAIHVGDRVKIKEGSKWYGSNTKIPNWVIGNIYTVDELRGSRALLDKKSINSPVDIKDLVKM